MIKEIKLSLIALTTLAFLLLINSNLHSGGDDFMQMIREEIKSHAPRSLKYEGRIMNTIANATRSRIIEPPLVTAIMTNESAYKQHAYSKKQARGLMQLMEIGARQAEWETGISFFDQTTNHRGKPIWKLNKDKLYDIENNIRGGISNLEWLAERYPMYYEDGSIDQDNLKVIIELYNVGWGNYHYEDKRNPKYVSDVMKTYQRHRKVFYDTYGTDEGFEKYCKNSYGKTSIKCKRR